MMSKSIERAVAYLRKFGVIVLPLGLDVQAHEEVKEHAEVSSLSSRCFH